MKKHISWAQLFWSFWRYQLVYYFWSLLIKVLIYVKFLSVSILLEEIELEQPFSIANEKKFWEKHFLRDSPKLNTIRAKFHPRVMIFCENFVIPCTRYHARSCKNLSMIMHCLASSCKIFCKNFIRIVFLLN